MRYLSLAEALVVAEVVTGLPARTLVRTASLDLLDSALHAPQAEFGGIVLVGNASRSSVP